MIADSTLDLQSLIEIIRHAYALPVVDLHFLQRGWGGDCYCVQMDSGEYYFLKVNDQVTSNETAASSRPFYLPLMHQLHAKNILPHIPYPIPTRAGTFSLEIDPQELVVTNWIDGKLVGFGKLPEPILARMAELVGILHRSRPQLEFEYPFIEQFEISFEADLLNSLAALQSISPLDSPGKQLLRQTLLPCWDDVLADLQRLKQLQGIVRSLHNPKVICHTDLHGANLMTDDQNVLYIIDWETALIAPLEHDMIFFAGEKNFWDVFWPNYVREFPQADLNMDMLAFYYYRRGLEDVLGLLLRILQGEGGEKQDLEDIGWLRECLEGLAEIEKTIEAVRVRLPHKSSAYLNTNFGN
jgi:spectinomycin phosphotransferase